MVVSFVWVNPGRPNHSGLSAVNILKIIRNGNFRGKMALYISVRYPANKKTAGILVFPNGNPIFVPNDN